MENCLDSRCEASRLDLVVNEVSRRIITPSGDSETHTKLLLAVVSRDRVSGVCYKIPPLPQTVKKIYVQGGARALLAHYLFSRKLPSEMGKQWDITQDAFDRFLTWLDTDRDRAGAKYEDIRRKLIKIFTCRNCAASEELADETINRVIRKIQELADSYEGDRSLYFYGVARNVHLEYVKRKPIPMLPGASIPAEQKEREDRCLEQCMTLLEVVDRELLLEYYRGERSARIIHRKEMAERRGIAPTALRIRTHRLRGRLQRCVENCVQQV